MLNLVRLPDDDPARDDLEALAGSRKTDTTGGTAAGVSIIAGCQLYAVEQFGIRQMTLAFQQGRLQPLRELWIMGAVGGNARAPLLPGVIELVEREAAVSFDVIALQTKRKGLIKQLLQHGFSADAVTLRKRLHEVH